MWITAQKFFYAKHTCFVTQAVPNLDDPFENYCPLLFDKLISHQFLKNLRASVMQKLFAFIMQQLRVTSGVKNFTQHIKFGINFEAGSSTHPY